jgi:hypothetical protein
MRQWIIAAALAFGIADASAQGSFERKYEPEIIPVGKWAEGVAFDGKDLWVAESGQRTVAQVAPDGSIKRHTVGRLPVDLLGANTGIVNVLVRTDQTIWSHERGKGARTIGKVPEPPAGMASGADSLFVLTWPTGSSADSRVFKVNPRTGAMQPTGSLGEWGEAITAKWGKAFVAHVRGEKISVIDQASLAVSRIAVRDASLWAIATDDRVLYAAGRIGGDNNRGVAVAIDPDSGRELARVTVNQRIARIAVDDKSVILVGETGTIWTAAPRTLELKGVGRLDAKPVRPSAALIQDKRLIVSVQQYEGENGALFILDGGFR